MQNPIVKAANEKWQKTLEHFANNIRAIRTGRASSSLVENVRVDYYGTPTPLNQLASITVPEARLLVVKPYDVGAIKEIEKAILKSDIGINPVVDGKILRLALPPLSEEQRKKLAAKVKEMAEQDKISLRNNRRDVMKMADDAKKNSELGEDEAERVKEELQKVFKSYEEKIDALLSKKSTEILEV